MADKRHDPTQHKLDTMRKRGDVARWEWGKGVYAVAVAVALSAIYGPLFVHLTRRWMTQLAQHGEAVIQLSAAWLTLLALSVILPAFAVLVWKILHARGIYVAGAIAPQGIQPAALLARIRGEILALIPRLALSCIVGYLVYTITQHLISLPGLQLFDQDIITSRHQLVTLLIASIGGLIVLATAASLLERLRYLSKAKMDDKELRDEHREQEGDPHVKGKQRAMYRALTREQMIKKLSQARVVIVSKR